MSTKAFFGGLLSGVGQGMIDQAEVQRREALEIAKRRERQAERAEDRRWQQEDAEARRNEVSKTITTEDGSVHGITAAGDTKPLGLTVESKTGPGKMSAQDKRTWDMVVSRFTEKGTYGDEQVDWDGVAREFETRGRSDLSRLAAPAGGTQAGREAAEETARLQAEDEAEGRTSFWRSRSNEFPETEGSKEEWINRRTQEILTGKSGGSVGGLMDPQGKGKQKGGDGASSSGRQSGSNGGQGQEGAQKLPRGPDGKVKASQLVVGQTYDTPRGLVRYLGNGEFEAE